MPMWRHTQSIDTNNVKIWQLTMHLLVQRFSSLPVTLNSMLAVLVFPTESITVHVWLPESAAFNADVDMVGDDCPTLKHCPEQVEDHRYVTGLTASDPTSHVRVIGEAARYSLLEELTDTERLPAVNDTERSVCK